MSLSKKIDFAVIIHVKNANPNGDPLNGNRPRVDYDGLGEISDVCIKRKIRDRLLEAGHSILIQSDDRKVDDEKSIGNRLESVNFGLGKIFTKKFSNEEIVKKVCGKWLDVRAFGQLIALKEKKEQKQNGVSIPIRGPVSIQSAFSIEPVSITSIQITKSVNGEGDGTKKGSDTMGMKHRVDEAYYVFYGSMNPQLAERTNFSDEDANTIKKVLPKLFENDASSARPEGSMSISKVYWWEHNCKSGQYSSSKVHGTLSVTKENEGYLEKLEVLEGLIPEVIYGF